MLSVSGFKLRPTVHYRSAHAVPSLFGAPIHPGILRYQTLPNLVPHELMRSPGSSGFPMHMLEQLATN